MQPAERTLTPHCGPLPEKEFTVVVVDPQHQEQPQPYASFSPSIQLDTSTPVGQPSSNAAEPFGHDTLTRHALPPVGEELPRQ